MAKAKGQKLAAILGIESGEIRGLAKAGVLTAEADGLFDLAPAILDYVSHLKNTSEVRELEEALLKERVEKTRAERERIEQNNAQVKESPVAADSKASLTMLAKLSKTDKGDAKATLVDAGIGSVKGARRADLYPLLPAMNALAERKTTARTVQESIIDRNSEDARLKRIQAERLEGRLADVDEILGLETELLSGIASIIKTSSLSKSRKGDILTMIRDHSASWVEKMTE